MTTTTYGPDLTTFCGNLTTGTKYDIAAQILFYVHVGTGTFTTMSANHIAFAGKVSVLGYSGNITIDIQVTGQNTGTIDINGTSTTCTFSSKGNTLVVHLSLPGKPNTEIDIHFDKGDLWVSGPGAPKNLKIGP